MKNHQPYLVGFSDRFTASDFPNVIQEIRSVKAKLESFAQHNKAEMILGLLRKPLVQTEHAMASSTLASFIASGQLFNGETESLLKAAADNSVFSQQLEEYIADEFKKVPCAQSY